MAQGDLSLFNDFSGEQMSGTHDLSTGGNQIRVALITTLPVVSEPAPTFASYTEIADGNGYTSPGFVISTNMAVTQVSGSTFKWETSNDPSWTQNGAGATNIVGALIYNDTAASNEAIGFVDMTVDGGSTPISLAAGNISITWNASGIFTLG